MLRRAALGIARCAQESHVTSVSTLQVSSHVKSTPGAVSDWRMPLQAPAVATTARYAAAASGSHMVRHFVDEKMLACLAAVLGAPRKVNAL